MQQGKVDARIQKTNEKLRNALLGILLEKQLSEITVSEICQRAGINRNTFYSHYQSVASLMSAIETDFSEALLSELKDAMTTYHGNLMSLMDVLMTTVRENRDMCIFLFSDNGSQSYLNKILDYCLPVALSDWTTATDITEEDGAMLYRFISGGAVYVISAWVRSRFSEPQESIVRKLSLYCQGILSTFRLNVR